MLTGFGLSSRIMKVDAVLASKDAFMLAVVGKASVRVLFVAFIP